MRLIVLTKSSKNKKLCVAGIDYDTGKWVRLVTDDETSDGAVSREDITDASGKEAQIFDVVSAETTEPENRDPVQPENALIDRKHKIRRIGTSTLKEALERHGGFDNPALIYNNSFSYIPEKYANGLDCSLQIIEATDLHFVEATNVDGQTKLKLSFLYNGNWYTGMSITDPAYFGTSDGREISRAALVISIGKPYNGKHYKFVSAIYPLE